MASALVLAILHEQGLSPLGQVPDSEQAGSCQDNRWWILGVCATEGKGSGGYDQLRL